MASQILTLIKKMRDGDRGALDDLMPLVYKEMRQIARAYMRHQRPGHTLQPTALVHEAFIKLFENDEPLLADRAHLLALASRAMRQVLVDHARAHGAAKRGGGEQRITWDDDAEVGADHGPQLLKLLELHSALEALAREDSYLAQLVEMHYFSGMTAEEVAVVVGRSIHAVRHDLRFARAWLRRKLA